MRRVIIELVDFGDEEEMNKYMSALKQLGSVKVVGKKEPSVELFGDWRTIFEVETELDQDEFDRRLKQILYG